MRLLFKMFTLALMSISASTMAASALKPAKFAKVYKSPDGMGEVTVLPLESKEVLLMVDRANSGLDGLILLHDIETQGTAEAFVLHMGGAHTRMRSQDQYGKMQYTLFLPEQPTKDIRLVYDEAASKAVNGEDFFARFEKQDMKAIKAKVAKLYKK